MLNLALHTDYITQPGIYQPVFLLYVIYIYGILPNAGNPVRRYQTVSGWPSLAEGLFRPPTDEEGGMPMTYLDLIALLSFAIAVFELGYSFGSNKKKN